MIFQDREEAGRQLAERLRDYDGRTDVVLLALPRGGVVVGHEIATRLHLRLDVIVTRKIGSPMNEEYAIGALAETGEIVWNEAEHLAADQKALARIVEDEKKEMARRVAVYRHGRSLLHLKGKTVVLIDDGVATGLTLRVAIAAVKQGGAKKILIAVPHGAQDTLRELRGEVDEVVVLAEPLWYGAVGQFYHHFPQVTDEAVLKLIEASYDVRPRAK